MPAKKTAKAPVKTAVKAPAKKAARTPARPAPAKAAAPKSRAAAAGKPVAAKRADAGKPVAASTVAAVKPIPAATSPAVKVLSEVKEKARKPKLVRDSFTMPEAEYQVLGDLKKACIKEGFAIKKSELLRVGVALLQKSDIAKLKSILAALPPLKAGRPKKAK